MASAQLGLASALMGARKQTTMVRKALQRLGGDGGEGVRLVVSTNVRHCSQSVEIQVISQLLALARSRMFA